MYRLRELERRDLPDINRWRNDPELISNLGAPFRFINPDVDNAWYEKYLASRSNTVRCAVTDESDQVIGLVTLGSIDHLNQTAEFHIMIGNGGAQNKGAGTFALKEILKHAFINLNLNRVELTVLETNERAIHLYEKVGFVLEGTKRKAKYKNGTFCDLHIYSILKDEYLKKLAEEPEA